MKLKKVLMILIALAVVLTMAGVVSATTGFKDDNDKMEVKYEVRNSYVITIPPDVTFELSGDKYFSSGQVNATEVLINPGATLIVNLTSNQFIGEGIYYLKNDNSWIRYYINLTDVADSEENPYAPTKGPVDNNDDVLIVPAGTEHRGLPDGIIGFRNIGDNVTLSFETTTAFIENATKSGDHTDTLTFQFRVDTTTPNN